MEDVALLKALTLRHILSSKGACSGCGATYLRGRSTEAAILQSGEYMILSGKVDNTQTGFCPLCRAKIEETLGTDKNHVKKRFEAFESKRSEGLQLDEGETTLSNWLVYSKQRQRPAYGDLNVEHYKDQLKTTTPRHASDFVDLILQTAAEQGEDGRSSTWVFWVIIIIFTVYSSRGQATDVFDVNGPTEGDGDGVFVTSVAETITKLSTRAMTELHPAVEAAVAEIVQKIKDQIALALASPNYDAKAKRLLNTVELDVEGAHALFQRGRAGGVVTTHCVASDVGKQPFGPLSLADRLATKQLEMVGKPFATVMVSSGPAGFLSNTLPHLFGCLAGSITTDQAKRGLVLYRNLDGANLYKENISTFLSLVLSTIIDRQLPIGEQEFENLMDRFREVTVRGYGNADG